MDARGAAMTDHDDEETRETIPPSTAARFAAYRLTGDMQRALDVMFLPANDNDTKGADE